MTNNKGSHQFGFYVLPQEQELLRTVVEDHDAVLLRDRSLVKTEVPLMDFDVTDEMYICPRSQIKNVILSGMLGWEFFLLDASVSPVIEFSPSRLYSGHLSAGRLYYHSGYMGREEWVDFSEELTQLYKTLCKAIRGMGSKNDKAYQRVVSRGALEFQKQGGELSPN